MQEEPGRAVRSTLAGLVLLAAAMPAAAEQALGWYVGAAGGVARAIDLSEVGERECEGTLNSPTTQPGASSTCTFGSDDWSRAWRVFGGLEFHRNFSIEAGYVDFGATALDTKSDLELAGGAVRVDNVNEHELEAHAFYAALVGQVGVTERVSLHGKVGLHRWEASRDSISRTQRTVPPSALVTFTPTSGRDHGFDLYLGAGTRFAINEHVSLQFEFEHFEGVGDSNAEGVARRPYQSNVQLYSAGVRLSF